MKAEGKKTFSFIFSFFELGSGAMESAIRRIVNLRMKCPCVFWTEEGANSMLMLRSYFKSGRWDKLMQVAYNGELMEAAS